MRKTHTIFLGLLVALAMGAFGCGMVSGGNGSLSGFIYTDYSMGGALGASQVDSKTGEACASTILGWVATGDASIEAAKKDGKITEVSYVDHNVSNILGIYATSCTVVHGQ